MHRLHLFIGYGLAACSLALLGSIGWKDIAFDLGIPEIGREVPYRKEVQALIGPLRYSGLEGLLEPDVRLEIDPEKKAWTLQNIHRFDAQGRVLLDEGRYGLCGDLAGYTFQNLKPLLGPDYSIDYMDVAESAYFPSGISQHYVLQITDNRTGQTYLLDPSLRRYGTPEQFSQYLLINRERELSFVGQRRTHETFEANTRIPLIIRRKFLIGLEVLTSEGKFDRENFKLALTAIPRYSYAAQKLLVLTMRNGRMEMVEKPENVSRFFDVETYGRLKKRLVELFEGASRPAA